MPGTHEMLQTAATLKRTILHKTVDTVTLSPCVQYRAFETALVSGGQVFLSALRCNACVLRITATLAAAAAPPPLPCAESLACYLGYLSRIVPPNPLAISYALSKKNPPLVEDSLE